MSAPARQLLRIVHAVETDRRASFQAALDRDWLRACARVIADQIIQGRV